MVYDLCPEKYLMTILYTESYPLDILTMNPHVSVIYVESYIQKGGGRQMAYLRSHLRGLPLTLRENFSTGGYLTQPTENRDIIQIEKEIKDIIAKLQAFNVVCFPILPFEKELENLKRYSPKVEKKLTTHLDNLKNDYI